MNMRESPCRCRTRFTIPGDSQSWQCCPICTNFSTLNSARLISIHSGGKTVYSNALGARAIMLDAGAPTNIALGANATGAIAVSGRSTTLLIPCCIGASDRWLTGSLPPFCCVSPVPPGALRGKWAFMSGPAIVGAGGSAMPRSPMRCSVKIMYYPQSG